MQTRYLLLASAGDAVCDPGRLGGLVPDGRVTADRADHHPPPSDGPRSGSRLGHFPDTRPHMAVVLCHPHPLMGGIMDVPLIRGHRSPDGRGRFRRAPIQLPGRRPQRRRMERRHRRDRRRRRSGGRRRGSLSRPRHGIRRMVVRGPHRPAMAGQSRRRSPLRRHRSPGQPDRGQRPPVARRAATRPTACS